MIYSNLRLKELIAVIVTETIRIHQKVNHI